MTNFRAGKYDRNKLGFLKPLAPIQSVHALVDVTPEELIVAGKKLILVDVDNTLVVWRSEEIPESTLTWLGFMKSAGLKICIISNTKRVARLERLAGAMDIPFLRGRFKPSRKMFVSALRQFSVKPEEAVMVGDQLFTDILGANRSGIDAIWVKQMAPKDFFGTSISRLGERLIRGHLHKAMAPDVLEDEVPIGAEGPVVFAFLRHPTVQQFVKFCVVGGLSTVIDIGLFWVLRFGDNERLANQVGQWLVRSIPILFGHYSNAADASVPVFRTISGTIAIVNSFLWNRRWTFNIRGREHRLAQLQKFFVVSVIGLLLNVGLTSGLVLVLPGPNLGQASGRAAQLLYQHAVKTRTSIALAIATVLVAVWNFVGQKYWTFKHKH